LVVIDYLQLITGTRADSRQQEVSDISRNLKILAKEMNCPVIALSQLSRRVEERQDHEPQLSDLRESGSIEQDADIVMFLYRKNYYDKEKEEQEETEVIDLTLAKHRNGSIGRIQLAFEKNISRFTNYAAVTGDDIYAG
jgi:replicative DNA helicase